MRRKLKQQKGETLVESLVAMLIATLSVMMLTAAITGAARVNRTNRDADEKYVQDLEYAEYAEYAENFENVIESGITITFTFEDSLEAFSVKKEGNLYGLQDGELASYK